MKLLHLGLYDINMRRADGVPSHQGRPHGKHISGAVHLMKVAAEVPHEAIEGEQPNVRAQIGFCWEYAVELVLGGMPFEAAMEVAFKRFMLQDRLQENVVKQVQFTMDDIHMTPDALAVVEGAIESYKWTWRSMKKARGGFCHRQLSVDCPSCAEAFSENFWPWLVAEKGYCLAAGVDTVRFYIGWANGDYSHAKGHGPQVTIEECVFEPKELLENWESVKKYAVNAPGE